jgi:hypothetical protein
MLWLPVLRVDVLNVVVPVLSRAFVPRMMLPSRNVTAPVGGCGVFTTVAVKVTACPLAAGFVLEDSVVADAAGGVGWITSVSVALVDEAESGVAPYVAVIACVPTERVERESVAAPLEVSVPIPRFLVPSRKFTDPEGVPCAPCTLAVKVMFCP